MTPSSAPLYVVIWQEPPSTRLRTYVSDKGNPRAYPLTDLSPQPTFVLETQADLEAWLNAPPPPHLAADINTAAIPASLAIEYLGWDPTHDPA